MEILGGKLCFYGSEVMWVNVTQNILTELAFILDSKVTEGG